MGGISIDGSSVVEFSIIVAIVPAHAAHRSVGVFVLNPSPATN